MNKSVVEPTFIDKLYHVILSCKTPQQMTVAGRYLDLAIKGGYIHKLDFSIINLVEGHPHGCNSDS